MNILSQGYDNFKAVSSFVIFLRSYMSHRAIFSHGAIYISSPAIYTKIHLNCTILHVAY